MPAAAQAFGAPRGSKDMTPEEWKNLVWNRDYEETKGENILDISVGTISFWFLGYGLMYGDTNGWIATSNLLFNPGDGAHDVFFQTVFCATAATIVSGALLGTIGSHFLNNPETQALVMNYACICLPLICFVCFRGPQNAQESNMDA